MSSVPSHALLETLIARHLQPLRVQLQTQHCLLLELVRQLPPHGLVRVAQQLEPLGQDATHWHLYVCQLAGLVDGQRPPSVCHERVR